MFIKRRAKLIRNQWRNGIAGVESVENMKLEASDEQILPKTDAR